MPFKSRIKWAGLVGLVLSVFSLLTHLILARYSGRYLVQNAAAITIFRWKPIFSNVDLRPTSAKYARLWGPVKPLESLHPHANPRTSYKGPDLKNKAFIFIKIRGGFHEIRNSICDVVAIARLLNAALVIPELQSTTSTKGISSRFKSFGYLYNEDQFITSLSKDILVVKGLPKNFKLARKKNEIPVFAPPFSASPKFYLDRVLPVLKQHSVVELLVYDGGCLQVALLPSYLEELQRLRCRVSFHALRFRREVQELGNRIVRRLQASGRPFLAYDPGMTKDALAYHGCAECFQDVHSELTQHRRLWMIKHHIINGKLSVDSMLQRLKGSCPLMPEEVGILLRAYGYPSDTIIYVSGGELFGGQRTMIPLHAMFDNVVDRTSLCTPKELSKIYGHEDNQVGPSHLSSIIRQDTKVKPWKIAGPRPRPLPPPPARPKYPYNVEGWWGWVGEMDKEPQLTIEEFRTQAHRLLWEAIDYIVSVEADAFIPGFDRDGMGHPNFASLVMGHRLYQSPASKTFRPNRKLVTKLLEDIREHLYQANSTWLTSVRRHLTKSVIEGLEKASLTAKPLSFLSHPVPECSCLGNMSTKHTPPHSIASKENITLRVDYQCPAWMETRTFMSQPNKDKQEEEDLDEADAIAGKFFQQGRGGGAYANGKEEVQILDQEELEGGDR
ncbi:hypothetical protein AMTRI_Chr10g231900 [Amborella trichopoda]